MLNRITKLGNTAGCVCEPAHVGVQGNEEADMATKRAINRENLDVEVRYRGAECKSLQSAVSREYCDTTKAYKKSPWHWATCKDPKRSSVNDLWRAATRLGCV